MLSLNENTIVVQGYYLGILWYFIRILNWNCEHQFLHTLRTYCRSKFNPCKGIAESMDKIESNEKALVVKSYKAFIKIKDYQDPGTGPIILSLVFLILFPIVTFDGVFGSNALCCGSILLGFAILVWGTIQSSTHWNRYKEATHDLANAVGLFLSESEENSNETKPRKIVLSQREDE